MSRLQESTGIGQELSSGIVETIAKKDPVKNRPDENLELNYQSTDQQMRSTSLGDAAYTAYDAIEHHKSFQQSQKSYNEVQEQYTEQALSVPPPQEEILSGQGQAEQSASVNVQQGQGYGDRTDTWKSPGMRGLETGAGKWSDGNHNSESERHEGFGRAEAPELWKNTHALQDKLEGKRKDVQRAYTRFRLGDHSTKARLKFNYYGRINISGQERELLHLGRLQYTGEVVREKRTRKDYEDILKRAEKKKFARRVKGRLAFRGAKRMVDDETLAEDELMGTSKRGLKYAGRTMALGVRRSVRTIKLQNNTYYRLELAKEQQAVLHDKRERLLSEEKRKQQREKLKAAQSREQKRKLKKQIVQQRAMEEGKFFTRRMQNRLVKKRAKDLRQKAVKKTLATVFSTAILVLVALILGFILFLVLVAVFTGGTNYYASAVTQNDYSTITDATEYFRNLETDMDEYLNADRDALEAELEAEYGPDLYEYVYNLADFGFSYNTLIAYLSARYGSFDLEGIEEELISIFEEMYTLTIEVKEEEREVTKYDPVSDSYQNVTELKKICYITLEKKELEEVVDARLQENERYNYDAYRLSTGGQQVYSPVMREDWTNKISSNFGERIHPITKERKPHNGVDIAVPTGTHLYSAVDGTVILAGYSQSAGNWVKVRTESGYTVIMMHMDSLTVSTGQTVKKGDHLGCSGNTGNSTGPHLHLEVRDPSDKAINPIFIIPQTCALTGKEETEQ